MAKIQTSPKLKSQANLLKDQMGNQSQTSQLPNGQAKNQYKASPREPLKFFALWYF